MGGAWARRMRLSVGDAQGKGRGLTAQRWIHLGVLGRRGHRAEGRGGGEGSGKGGLVIRGGGRWGWLGSTGVKLRLGST